MRLLLKLLMVPLLPLLSQQGALVFTFFVYKPVIDSYFWVAFFVLVAAVDAAVTFVIVVDVHNIMK